MFIKSSLESLLFAQFPSETGLGVFKKHIPSSVFSQVMLHSRILPHLLNTSFSVKNELKLVKDLAHTGCIFVRSSSFGTDFFQV